MKTVQVKEKEGKNFVVVLDKGDEVIESLTRFVTNEQIMCCSVAAIGAFDHATLAYFDRRRMDYDHIPVDEQVEVVSLLGNVIVTKSTPKVHVHAVLGMKDGSTRAGHLIEGYVWPTLEIVIEEMSGELVRTVDDESGLALIDIPRKS